MEKKGTKLTMTTTGKEESYAEIVYNNLIDYMEEKGISKDMQREYLKNSLLYLEYENSKRKLANMVGFAPALLCLLGVVGSLYISKEPFAYSLLYGSGAFTLYGLGVKLFKKNPYENNMANLNDVKNKERVYHKVAKFVK